VRPRVQEPEFHPIWAGLGAAEPLSFRAWRLPEPRLEQGLSPTPLPSSLPVPVRMQRVQALAARALPQERQTRLCSDAFFFLAGRLSEWRHRKGPAKIPWTVLAWPACCRIQVVGWYQPYGRRSAMVQRGRSIGTRLRSCRRRPIRRAGCIPAC